MTRLAEGTQDYEKHVFECECGCCFLRMYWDDDDPDFRFLWITSAVSPHLGWRKRIKYVWRMLRGHAIEHTDIVLDEEKTRAIADAMRIERVR